MIIELELPNDIEELEELEELKMRIESISSFKLNIDDYLYDGGVDWDKVKEFYCSIPDYIRSKVYV